MSFISEIQEHPSALRTFMERQLKGEEADRLAQFLKETAPHRIIFSGMGSSFFSSEITALYLRRCGIDAVAIESGELIGAEMSQIDDADLLVVVSQTGKSPEVVKLCQCAQGKLPILTVTNRKNGMIVPYGNQLLELYAGEELFTASKTYTNTLAALMMVARLLTTGSRGLGELAESLEGCVKALETILADQPKFEQLADTLRAEENYCFIGSGYSCSTASHSELIAAEAAKIFSSKFSTGQFIHGPIEIIRKGFTYFVIDTNPDFEQPVERIISTVLRLGGKVVHICSCPKAESNADYMPVVLPQTLPELYPILEVVAVELIIQKVGLNKGLVPGELTIVQK